MRDTVCMVDIDLAPSRPKGLQDQVDWAIDVARDEEFELPCAEEVERVRAFLARVEALGGDVSDNTWVSVGVDGRFAGVTDTGGHRISWELEGGPSGFGFVDRDLRIEDIDLGVRDIVIETTEDAVVDVIRRARE